MNKRGPKTEPSGIPDNTSDQLENTVSIITVSSTKKELMQLIIVSCSYSVLLLHCM